jgi:copper(I)-binding protein
MPLTTVSLFFVQPSTGLADETSEVASGIIIEEAVLAPANKGERARLRFKITNLSTRNVTLQGIRAAVAKSAEVKMKHNEEGFKPVEGFPILREETLNFLSSHIRIELVDLLEDLEPNSKIEFTVIFNHFETSAIADVH